MKHNYTSTLMRTLSAAILLMLSTVTWAYDFEVDGIYYNVLEDEKSVEVTRGPQEYSFFGTTYIPSTVEYIGKIYDVTCIGDSAFSECYSLTSIDIPESVTSIGNEAFCYCHNLTSIDIPESVASIGVAAFSGCTSLTSIDIPFNVPNIGVHAFAGCSSLTSIDIPFSVQSIEAWAFSGCTSLTSINIPSSVTNIEYGIFDGCSSLTSVTVSVDNPVYDSREGCNAIIEQSTNKLIAGIQNTVIPQNIESIGSYAFSDVSITSIDLPSSLLSIEFDAFCGCSLTSVYIPENVESIGCHPFRYCPLSSITVSVDNHIYDSREGCNAIIETATNMLVVGCQNTVLPESVESIGDCAFDECFSLTSINIPESVTSIGDWAFSGCTSLTSIDIPGSVTSIGRAAFQCCSITSIDIPSSVTNIGAYAFNACDSLVYIGIPSFVTSIGDHAFANCDALTTVACRAEDVPNGSDIFCDTSFESATLYVPSASIEAYKAADGWKAFGTILPLEDCETGIASPAQDNGATTIAAPYYTLAGHRVTSPVRSRIYIRSGRKVIY